MADFAAQILAFPTVFFTILLALSVFYWLVSIVGLAGAEGLEGADGALDGAADGLGEAPEAIDGMGGKGAGLDAATLAADAAADRKPGSRDRKSQRKPKIPAPVRLSLFSLSAWVSSFLLMYNLAPANPGLLWIGGVGLASVGIGLAGGRLLGSPLAGLFAEPAPVRARDMIGQTCEVTTGRVNERFGQGLIGDGGAGLVVNIRCEPDKLSRGAHALVVDYDEASGVYRVEPLDSLLGARDEMT